MLTTEKTNIVIELTEIERESLWKILDAAIQYKRQYEDHMVFRCDSVEDLDDMMQLAVDLRNSLAPELFSALYDETGRAK